MHFIHTDIDAVWLRNPLPGYLHPGSPHDMVFTQGVCREVVAGSDRARNGSGRAGLRRGPHPFLPQCKAPSCGAKVSHQAPPSCLVSENTQNVGWILDQKSLQVVLLNFVVFFFASGWLPPPFL